MSTVATLTADLSVNTSKFEAGMISASRALKNNQNVLNSYVGQSVSGFTKIGTAVTSFVGTFGALAAVSGVAAGALIELTRKQVESAAAIQITAERLGLTTTQLQEYQFAAKEAGLQNDEFEVGVTKLNAKIADGTLKYKNTNVALLAIANQVQNAKTKIEQLAIVNDNFGKKIGAKMLPLLLQGADGLRRMGIEAERTGNVIDASTIAATKKLGDTLDQFQSTITKNFSQGFLTELVGGGTDLKKLMEDPAFERGIKAIGAALGDLAGYALDALNVLGKLTATLQILNEASKKGGSQSPELDNMIYQTTADNMTDPKEREIFLANIKKMQIKQAAQATANKQKNSASVNENSKGINTGGADSGYQNPSNGITDAQKIKDLKEIFSGLDKENAELTAQNSLYGQQASYIDAAKKAAEIQNALAKDGITLTQAQTDELNKKLLILQQQKQLQADEAKYQSDIKGLTSDIEGGFEDAILGGKKLSDVFNSLVVDMEKILLKKNVLDQLFGDGSQGSTGFLTTAISGLGSLLGFSNPMASHATGQANVPYDMDVRLHKGERVDTAQAVRSSSGGGDVVLNITNKTDADITAQKTASGNNGTTLEVMVDRANAKNISKRGSATGKALSNYQQRTLVRR